MFYSCVCGGNIIYLGDSYNPLYRCLKCGATFETPDLLTKGQDPEEELKNDLEDLLPEQHKDTL